MSYTPEIQNIISTNNSVVLTNVSGGTVWTGTSEDVTKYGRAGISIWTPYGEFCDGILTIEVSRDGTNWGGPNRTFSNTAIAQPHMWNIVEKYFRLKYTHGTTSASTLVIQTQYSVNADTILGHQLDETLIDETEAIVTRSVLVGQNPTNTYVNAKEDGVAFSTTTPLSGSGVYTSSIISTDGYSQIETQMFSNQSGTLVGQWYSDSAGTKIIRTFTRPYTGTEVSGTSYFSSPVFGPYVKYTYTNGSVAQSDFYLSFNLRTKAISGQVLGVNDFIPSGVVANLGRNVVVGQDYAGNFRNVGVDSEGHMKVNMDEPLTAFGEMSVAEPTPVAQVDFVYGINNQMIATATTSGGTFNAVDGNIVVTTSAVTGSMAIAYSQRYVKYRDGQGSVGRFTALFTSGVTGNNQYAGLATPTMSDGYFFGYSGTTFGIIHDSSGNTVGFYPQTSWNEDTMDGSRNEANPSGQLLNPTKGNVYQIKLQYLGYGSIYFYVENSDNGELVNVHNIKYANTNTIPSLRQPSLNLVWASENTTNNTAVSVKGASGALFTEGKVQQLGPRNSFDFNKAGVTAANNVLNIFTIKNATTFNGITNRSQVRIKGISVANDMGATASGLSILQVHKNATVAGTPVFSAINGTLSVSGATITNGNSVVSYDTSATTVTSNANSFVVFNTSISRNSNTYVDTTGLDIYLNPGDTMTFGVKTTTTAAISVSVNWSEDI